MGFTRSAAGAEKCQDSSYTAQLVGLLFLSFDQTEDRDVAYWRYVPMR